MLDLYACFWNFSLSELHTCTAITSLVLLATLVCLFVSLTRTRSGEHGYSSNPPGPFALPLVGNILQLGKSPHVSFAEMANIYGDVFSLRLGCRRVIVVNSLTTAREVLNKKARQFSDRPPLNSFQLNSNDGKSIAFGNTGPLYRYHKKYATKALLRVFENDDRLDQISAEEIYTISGLIKTRMGKPIELDSLLKEVVYNFSFRVMFGDSLKGRFSEEMNLLVNKASDFVESNPAVNLLDAFPWLQCVLAKKSKKIKEAVDELLEFIRRVCKARAGQVFFNNERACVAGALEETRNTNQETAEQLSEDSMVGILADLYGAGLETVSTSLSWAIAFLSRHKELQMDLHAELDRVVGANGRRAPKLKDKSKLPLLQATVLETLRLATVLPFGLPHYCSEDSTVGGYRVEKGTVVIINLWTINHDPKYFKEPHVFNPRRFLSTDNGELCLDSTMRSLPFSTGTRRCLGSTLAKAELFLLLAGLLCDFKFEASEGQLEEKFGLILRPKPYKVHAYPRFGHSTSDV